MYYLGLDNVAKIDCCRKACTASHSENVETRIWSNAQRDGLPAEYRPISGWDRFTSLGHPSKFQWVWGLGFVTAPT